MKCLQAGPDVCLDRTLLIEASEGLEKAKLNILYPVFLCENFEKDAECMKQQAAELLGRRTSSDIDCAVTVISKGLMVREILGVVSTAQVIFHVCSPNLLSRETHQTEIKVVPAWASHLQKAFQYHGKSYLDQK